MRMSGLDKKRFVIFFALVFLLSCRSSSRYESREKLQHATQNTSMPQWPETSRRALVQLWHMYPEQASLLNMHSYDTHLASQNPLTIKNQVDQLSRLVQKLYAIPNEALSSDQILDRQLLSARLRLTIQAIAVEARPLHDPYAHIETLSLAIASLWLNVDRALDQRLGDLASRLLKVPVFLGDALQNLHQPDPVLCLAAQKKATRLKTFLQRDLQEQAQHSSKDLQQALELGISEASRGLENYRKGLQKICVPKQKLFALGQVAFRQRMALEHGLYWGPDAVRTEALRWKSRANRMLKLIGNKTSTPVLDVTVQKPSKPKSWTKSINLQISNLKLLSQQNHLFDLAPGDNPVLSRVCKLNRLQVSELYLWPQVTTDDGKQTAVLLDGLSTLYSGGQPTTLQQNFSNSSELALTLARETYPGRLAQRQHKHPKLSQVRSSFITSSLDAGWGLYAQDLALKFGIINNDAAAQRFFWNSLRNIAALAIVDVGIHSKQMSLADALDYLREQSDLPGALAMGINTDREAYLNKAVVDILSHPTRASANLLAYASIEGMRQRLQNLRGASFSLQAFHDALLSHGQIPPAYLSALIFKDPLPELDPFFPPAPIPNQAQ